MCKSVWGDAGGTHEDCRLLTEPEEWKCRKSENANFFYKQKSAGKTFTTHKNNLG